MALRPDANDRAANQPRLLRRPDDDNGEMRGDEIRDDAAARRTQAVAGDNFQATSTMQSSSQTHERPFPSSISSGGQADYPRASAGDLADMTPFSQHRLTSESTNIAAVAPKSFGDVSAAMAIPGTTNDSKASGAEVVSRLTDKYGEARRKWQKKVLLPQWKDHAMDKLGMLYQKAIIEGILRRKPLSPSQDGRHIPLNPPDVGPHGLIDERSNKPYISNFIRSSRYTAYDFLPKQLIFQFSKLGNFYLLVMGILQAIPGLSTVGRFTTIAPLAGFVAFSMAKEGYDDYRRYQLDKSENRSLARVLTHGVRLGQAKPRASGPRAKTTPKESDEDAILHEGREESSAHPDGMADWTSVQWQHVQVGDVVRLHRDDAVPADMVLLHATGLNGIAYIETMALDGETNLKAKQPCSLLAAPCNTTDGIKSIQATVVSEDPNLDLYSYDGRVTIGGKTMPLSLNNVVYRGSTLRNTKMAIGLVINSGEECKIRMNANKNVHAKSPAMQSIINFMVLFQICIVVLLATGLTIGHYRWKRSTENRSWYIVSKGVYDGSVSFKQIFVGYLIMFNTLIPLSLYISLEIIKIGQLLLLHDVDMYDSASNTPMVANTSTILENLGQVSYVFSDKTGTLTENLMRFRKLSVAGVAFRHELNREGIKTSQKSASVVGNSRRREMHAIPPNDADRVVENDKFESSYGAPKRLSTTSSPHWKSSSSPTGEAEMSTEDLLNYIHKRPNTTFSQKAKQFLLCIALCHTCLPERSENGELEYQAASPDELALIEAARDLGFLLIDRPAQSIQLQIQDSDGRPKTETYRVLDVIEFSSKRKRMSIIIRMPGGRICIFCKGADNVIMSRLKRSHLAEQKATDISRRASLRRTFEQDKAIRRRSSQMSGRNTPRSSFAMNRTQSSDRLEGLRRSIGRRSTDLNRLSQADGMAAWLHRRHTEELASPRNSADLLRSSMNRRSSFEQDDDRIDESAAANDGIIFERCFQHVDDFATEGLRTLLYAYRYIDESTYTEWKALYRKAETSLVDRQERIERVAEQIESKFELAGATAIEDKLQEGVPETIDKLRRANIKVWMLTGDKRETAINIGHSARVCRPFSEIYILDVSGGNLHETLTTTLNEVARGMVPHSVVVVDGQTLAVIDAEYELSALFYDLIVRVDSVICCRASPSQKANLVKSIRKRVPKSMTLAIGDGANDIGMIQASHVGIGISGREGLQAARISDFSIAQFRFLQKLLFVHGRWNYIRTGKYVLATFWKEIFFYLIQAHFQRFTGYTGTSLYESWSLTLFNGAFTSLPVILLGIFDKDLQASTLLAVPELYSFGQQGRGFSFKQYFGWAVMGVAESFVVFYFTLGVFGKILFTEDNGLFAMGTVCFTVGVIFINIKLLILEFHSKTVIPIIGLIIELLGWFLWNLILSAAYAYKVAPLVVRNSFIHAFGRTLNWWTTLLLVLIAPIIMELVVQSIRRVYWPTDQDLMQRIEKDSNAKQILRQCAANGAQDIEAGHGEGIEMDEVMPPGKVHTRPSDDYELSSAQHDGAGRSRSRSPHPPPAAAVGTTTTTPSVRFPESGRRKSWRASYDQFRPPNFTPPTEEENPFERNEV